MSRRTLLLGILGCAGVCAVPAGVASAAAAIPSAAALGPLINVPQTYNNCGPAAIAEVLAYWGISRTQSQVQSVLRVDGPVIGMTPYGVPSYVRSLGLRALMGVGGTETLVKSLIAARLPIMVHQTVSLGDDTGHWRPVEAYDDAQQIFVTSDPYLGPGYRLTYDTFDRLWAERDGTFIVIYPQSRQRALSASLAATRWNRATAYRNDLALVTAGRLDVSPAAAPSGSGPAYRYLGMAWDNAQLGRFQATRACLKQATRAGANPVVVRWIDAEIG